LLSVARSRLGYASRLGARDAPLMGGMREFASQYPRDGYRKIRIFLARRGQAVRPARYLSVVAADRVHAAPSTAAPRAHLPTAAR
jgi:hypothetical protein